jgi:hypothetical protein
MAIQVGSTTVISNNREVSNVSGFKTVSGESILGSGDIDAGGGAPWDAAGTWTSGTSNQSSSGASFLNGSTNGRWFMGVLQNGNTMWSYFQIGINGNNSFMQVTGGDVGGQAGGVETTNYITASTGSVTFAAKSGGGNNPYFGAYYVRGFLGPSANLHKNANQPNMYFYYFYQNA